MKNHQESTQSLKTVFMMFVVSVIARKKMNF